MGGRRHKVSCWDVGCQVELDRLLAWCQVVHGVDQLLVVSRPETDGRRYTFDPDVARVVKSLFRSSILSTVNAQAWPGSRLFGHSAKVYRVALNESVAKRMIASENLVANWTHARRPPLPEDICLLRAGDRFPVFISVTHEGDAWLLSDRGAEFEGAKPCDATLDDLCVPQGETFIQPTT